MTTDSQTKTGVAMCFGTAGGSAVVLTRHEIEMPLPGYEKRDCSWECLGCGEGVAPDDLRMLTDARKGANQHAMFCRAMSRDAWPRSVT